MTLQRGTINCLTIGILRMGIWDVTTRRNAIAATHSIAWRRTASHTGALRGTSCAGVVAHIPCDLGWDEARRRAQPVALTTHLGRDFASPHPNRGPITVQDTPDVFAELLRAIGLLKQDGAGTQRALPLELITGEAGNEQHR